MPTNIKASGFASGEVLKTAAAAEGAEKIALDDLFIRLYKKIRSLASRLQWRGTNPTLGPTALANETYLKLLKDPPDFGSKSPEEVIAVFANAMRQILVDAARRKHAQKRDADSSREQTTPRVEDALTDWLTVDAVLADLEHENSRQRQIVDCRFYLGMTVDETAAALNLSPTTIEREWREARARLGYQIRPEKR
jgi:RNA polymerase sigma factor (TIGR02999 family)